MEASLCCHKYHGKETPTKPTCPTAGPAHLTAEPSLANDFHIFFLYIYFKIYELNNFGLLVYSINQPINLMETSLCCHKYHDREAPAEPTCPTVGLAHLTAKLSLANDIHIFFLYIL